MCLTAGAHAVVCAVLPVSDTTAGHILADALPTMWQAPGPAEAVRAAQARHPHTQANPVAGAPESLSDWAPLLVIGAVPPPR